MNFLQDLTSDNHMEIRLHEIEYEVDILIIFSFDGIGEPDYVRVVIHLLEEHNFSVCSLRIRRVMKCIKHFFYCYRSSCFFVCCFPYYPVRSFS